MKKLFYISGSLAAILLILFLIGAINFSKSMKDTALTEGNRLMESGRYQEAFEVYENGLKEYPQDPELSYNAGQALYSMGDYSRAAEYYGKSSLSTPERYLNMGNCSLKQNDYGQAVERYKQGILEFPQDVSLKYNYEYALEKISQREQQDGDEGEEQSGEGEEQGSGEEGEEQGSGEEGEEQGSGEEGEEQDGSEGEEQGGEEGEEQDGSEGEEQGGEGEEQGSGEDEEQGDIEGAAEEKQARSVIENALEALEKQEAESLKNNRNQKHIYEEGEYEW